ncbi:hypothetical protein [uncultured Rubinisphaera sp.]|uniref:hypothetical protein n=1 Tax=uncultured Rubinisphaera sp. TaxID=1678686 RepID=UPI0030DB0FE6
MTIMNHIDSETNSSIVLHGIKFNCNKLQVILDESLKWMIAHGHKPDLCSYFHKGRWSKLAKFESGIKRITKDKFLAIEGFSLHDLSHNAQKAVSEARFSVITDPINQSLYVGCHTDIGLAWSSISETYINNMIISCNPQYAYGFLRERQKGPYFYTCGIIVGLSSGLGRSNNADEVSRITRWGNYGANAISWAKTNRNAYEIGDLRDLYPWNYLTEPALKRDINGTTLLQWIQASPERGELKPVGNVGFIWRLTDEQIAATRPVMIEADILFDPRPIEYLDHVTWAREARERLGYRGEE